MPHKCTRCESIFKDGAAIILNGCPKCGWNKFLYVRDETPAPEQVIKPDATVSAGQISPEASKFIQEVDEMLGIQDEPKKPEMKMEPKEETPKEIGNRVESCLLYTSDAADDLLCVDLGGR